jgi:hypothetical protein
MPCTKIFPFCINRIFGGDYFVVIKSLVEQIVLVQPGQDRPHRVFIHPGKFLAVFPGIRLPVNIRQVAGDFDLHQPGLDIVFLEIMIGSVFPQLKGKIDNAIYENEPQRYKRWISPADFTYNRNKQHF